MKHLLRLSILALLLGAASFINAAPPAHAAANDLTFTVNQTADLDDFSRFDNRCDTTAFNSGDQCSLRAAIQQANFTDGTQTIRFVSSAEHGLARSGTDDNASKGDLDITGSVIIEGHAPRTIIDGNGVDRVFEIHSGTVTLSKLLVRGGNINNSSGAGVTVRNGATVALLDVIVRENTVLEGPGGISNGGNLTLDKVTVDDNTTLDGESFSDMASNGQLTMLNSAVGGLTLRGTAGATIVNSTVGFIEAFGLASLRNVTTSVRICNLFGFECGSPNQTNLFNSIITSCSGTYSLLGYNLIQNTNGCTLTGNQAGNLLNVDPQLQALANNGGPTQTRALGASSPAIDAGNPAGCAGLNGQTLTTDQRGFPRLTDGNGDSNIRCDIGAFEAGAVGVGVLSPRKGSSDVGEQQVFDLAWDSPTRWRDLNTVDLRFERGEHIALWLRFNEALPTSTFSILDRHGNVVDSGTVGEAKILSNKFGEISLASSGFTASGPNDPHVVLHFAVTFHAKAKNGKLLVQTLASDDFADQQGPEPVGTWQVK